jgi:hypothetical protein
MLDTGWSKQGAPLEGENGWYMRGCRRIITIPYVPPPKIKITVGMDIEN